MTYNTNPGTYAKVRKVQGEKVQVHSVSGQWAVFISKEFRDFVVPHRLAPDVQGEINI